MAVVLLTCAAAPVSQTPRWTRAQMEAAPPEPARMRFVYGTLDPAVAPSLHEWALEIATRLFGANSAQVVSDREATAANLAAGSIVLLGNPRQNAWTQRLAGGLPVEFTAQGFRWRGTGYDRAGDVLALVYPNPLLPLRFLFLIAPNSPAAPGPHLGYLLGGDDWRITREGERVRSGTFAQSIVAPWRYDPALDHDREAERTRWARGLRRLDGGALEVRAPAALASAAPALAAAGALLTRLDAMGLASPRGHGLTLTLYRSLEEKGLLTLDTRPEHVDNSGAAHAALAAGRDAYDLWSVASARLVALGGTTRSRFLAPAGAWLVGRLEGEPLERAIARAYFGRVLPSAADASTRPGAWRSPLLSVPARSLIARAVWESAPAAGRRAALMALVGRDPPGTLDSLCASAGVAPAAVENRYRALADSLAYLGRRSLALRQPVPWRPADGFAGGVCLAHDARLEDGYASAACARTLRTLRDARAGWVSLTPFGYMSGGASPEILPSAEGGPDEENDEAIAEAAARAHALGLKLWLVPHLWSPGGPGALVNTPSGWAPFLDRYRAFVLHYALLADRERIEGLSVGHEMAGSTARDPQAWRALIATVRGVYAGSLTYVANWDEVARVPFWDTLDLVGVTFYAPLASQPTRDPGTLRAGASRALASLEAVARRAGRPVLLAEAGYAPDPGAAVQPWLERRGPVDLETQSACYEALVAALEGREWVAGALWWKWPSSGAGGGDSDPSFTPLGKPAERVMRSALKRWDGRAFRAPVAR